MERFADLWWAAQSARWAILVEFWWVYVVVLSMVALWLIVSRLP